MGYCHSLRSYAAGSATTPSLIHLVESMTHLKWCDSERFEDVVTQRLATYAAVLVTTHLKVKRNGTYEPVIELVVMDSELDECFAQLIVQLVIHDASFASCPSFRLKGGSQFGDLVQ
jgi:hypothetical protein